MTLLNSHFARRAGLGIALLGAMAGCGRFHQEESLAGAAYLIFSNQSLEQADVFAIPSGGEVIRLGTVQAGQTDTLIVRPEIAVRSPLNIAARLLARSIAPQSGPVTLGAGERFQVTLPLDARTLIVLPAR